MGNFMSNRVIRALSLIMVIAVPASMLSAETHAAMVFATGMASLNGAALRRTTAVFAGDTLETSKDSSLIINANGSSVRVGPASKVQFQGESIGIASGVTQVTTNTGMKVLAEGLSVIPTGRTAKYQVTRGTGKVLIAALSGSVSVVNGRTSEVVAAGETKTFSEDQDEQDQEKEKRKKDKVGAVVFTSDKTLFIWSAAALATGGTLAWWFLRDDRKPLSTQLP